MLSLVLKMLSFSLSELLENMVIIFTLLEIKLVLYQYKAQQLVHRQGHRLIIKAYDCNAFKLYT